MSARAAFVPSKAAPQKQSQGGRDLNAEGGATTNSNMNGRDASAVLALKDASNSFRPTSQTANDSSLMKSGLDADKDNAARNFAGIAKPLNISALIQPKPKKSGDNTKGNAKKMRTPGMDKLKENDPTAATRSPKPLVMSPSRLPRASGLAPSLMISHHETTMSTSDSRSPPQVRLAGISEVSETHITNEAYKNSAFTRLPTLSSNTTFNSAGSVFSDVGSPRPRRDTLDPAKREVFPLRAAHNSPLDLTQTRDSLSPPPPRQSYPLEGHRDFQVPIDTHGFSDHQEQEHRLRRSTKRLNMHLENHGEEAFVPKRAKVDANQPAVLASVMSFSRPSTPYQADRHTSPDYNAHSVQAYGRHASGSPARMRPQATSPQHTNTGRGRGAHPDPEPEPEPEPEPAHAALYRLLGTDMEQFLAAHVDQYEAEKKRWTACSLEEWKAGAEEMSDKFAKVTDFVKEHMSTKLALFADLHARVSAHKTTLAGRAEMLQSTRARLVKSSGIVIDGAAGNAGGFADNGGVAAADAGGPGR